IDLSGYAELAGDNRFSGDNSFDNNLTVNEVLGAGAVTIGSNKFASIHSESTSTPVVIHDGPSYGSSTSSIFFGAGGGFAAPAVAGGLHFAALSGPATFQTSGNITMWSTSGDIVHRSPISRPFSDGSSQLGSATHRWGEVFAVNGAINTSDAREKTEPRDLTEAEIAAAADIARLPCVFQWLSAIEDKGEDARLHIGPTVQAVITSMESHGLNPMRYGFVCHDEWEAQEEKTVRRFSPEGGFVDEVLQEALPAGDVYS